MSIQQTTPLDNFPIDPNEQRDQTGSSSNKMFTRSLSLRAKLTIWFVILASVTSIILTITLFVNIRNYLWTTTKQNLLNIVSVASLQVNADANASLTKPEQEGNSTYLEIKRTLQQIENINDDIRYVYTARYINHQLMFIVDAESDPNLISHLGDIYEESLPSALAMMENATKPYIEPEISSDRWGTWITGCAPLFLSNGERGDFLCMDMSVGHIATRERQFLWISLATLGGMILLVVGAGWWLGQRLTTPLKELISGAQHLAEGDLQHRVRVSSGDETAFLAQTFNSMAAQLNGMVNTLEKQVEERTGEVSRRSSYLTAAAEVGRVANTILDTERLAQQVIELIQKQFDLYYVGLFLTSDDGKWAVLQAGTGETGKIMVSRNHRIAIGEGLIGWCIANGQSRISHEVSQDSIRIATPELPRTQSEAALPLITRGRIIGAITVQSEYIKAFDETAMVALQTMADLFAIALDNANLFAENNEALVNARKAYGEINQTDWVKFISSQSNFGYYASKDKLIPLNEHSIGLDLSQDKSLQVLHLPIRVRGQILGTIHARKTDSAGIWNPEETALMETLTDQLSIALDNARLYRESLRNVEREHIISNITAKVRSSTNVDVILQTAVRELADALRVSKATIQLHNDSQGDGGNHRENALPGSNGDHAHA